MVATAAERPGARPTQRRSAAAIIAEKRELGQETTAPSGQWYACEHKSRSPRPIADVNRRRAGPAQEKIPSSRPAARPPRARRPPPRPRARSAPCAAKISDSTVLSHCRFRPIGRLETRPTAGPLYAQRQCRGGKRPARRRFSGCALQAFSLRGSSLRLPGAPGFGTPLRACFSHMNARRTGHCWTESEVASAAISNEDLPALSPAGQPGPWP